LNGQEGLTLLICTWHRWPRREADRCSLAAVHSPLELTKSR